MALSDADLPGWARAYADRVLGLARRRRGLRRTRRALGDALAVLRLRAMTAEGEARALRAVLDACLDLFEKSVVTRPAFLPFLAEARALCALARAELDGGADDRALLARQDAWPAMPAEVFFALRVPGRVVFLAALARGLPAEAPTAAVMLVNDLATLRRDLPLRALEAGLRPL